jgi:hypothetical protein
MAAKIAIVGDLSDLANGIWKLCDLNSTVCPNGLD